MTLALIIWCCYEFNKNEDVCEVLFKTFHEDRDSIYPEITFGVQNRFNETALKAYNQIRHKQHLNKLMFICFAFIWNNKKYDAQRKLWLFHLFMNRYIAIGNLKSF